MYYTHLTYGIEIELTLRIRARALHGRGRARHRNAGNRRKRRPAGARLKFGRGSTRRSPSAQPRVGMGCIGLYHRSYYIKKSPYEYTIDQCRDAGIQPVAAGIQQPCDNYLITYVFHSIIILYCSTDCIHLCSDPI